MHTLFKRLYNLLKQSSNEVYEDYLTELFAEVFREPEGVVSFFEYFGNIQLDNPTSIDINTQQTFPKILSHATDSRPDLVLRFKEQGRQFLVLFENKLDAHEGDLQLQRYADHLRIYHNNGVNTYLFYVSRKYDPKDEMHIFKNGRSAKFISIRWYKIYTWLQLNRNAYVDLLIDYMEVLGLNENRRFNPQDVYAIQQLNRLQYMMDQCLDETVDETMTALFGKAIGWSNRSFQLRDHYRYLKSNDQGDWTWIGCGFYLTDDEYPLISVIYETGPNCSKRNDTISAMNEFLSSHNDWEGYELTNHTKWAGICADKSLLDILSADDHILEIQKFFTEKLKELSTLKKAHPGLEWKS